MLSGPIESLWAPSAPSASSSGELSTPSERRRASSTRTRLDASRRSAKASAPADDSSNHWMSSIAIRSGSSAASSSNALRVASPSALRSVRSPADSSSSKATSSARRLGGAKAGSTSPSTSSNRSPSPTSASPRSASAGRDERMRRPWPRACSTPARQRVDLPIPTSPSRTSVDGPSTAPATNAARKASSSSLPTISTITFHQRS